MLSSKNLQEHAYHGLRKTEDHLMSMNLALNERKITQFRYNTELRAIIDSVRSLNELIELIGDKKENVNILQQTSSPVDSSAEPTGPVKTKPRHRKTKQLESGAGVSGPAIDGI